MTGDVLNERLLLMKLPSGLKGINLSPNAARVLTPRYTQLDEHLQPIETPEEVFWRVALHVASAQKLYGGDVFDTAIKYYNMMADMDFLPNSPTIANAGTNRGNLSACLHPSQPVLTKDGYKSISQIRVGETVFTHNGNWKPVKEVMQRSTESILKIRIWKLPKETLLITGEHPVLTLDGWKTAKNLRKEDYVVIPFDKREKTPDYLDLSAMLNLPAVEGKIGIPIKGYRKDTSAQKGYRKNSLFSEQQISQHENTITQKISVDNNFMWFLGMYLAEGSLSRGYDIRFTLAREEIEYAERIRDYIQNVIGVECSIIKGFDKKRNSSWMTVRTHSKILYRFLDENFGHGFGGKYLPEWIMTFSPEKQKHLLRGVADGDGCKMSNGIELISLSNEKLIRQLFYIALRCGEYPSIRRDNNIPRLGTTYSWHLSIGHKEGPNQYIKISEDGNIGYKIRNIEDGSYAGEVWNLEVEDDHTYVDNFVAVHNCYVQGPQDNMESIMKTANDAAFIVKYGGGIGFSLSALRPKNDVIGTTHGMACGPIKVMKLYSEIGHAFTQGAFRLGAFMAELDISHPDIREFIHIKDKDNALINFNISVIIPDTFMKAVETDNTWNLINPHNGKIVETTSARGLWNEICESAWKTGDPGVAFIDRIRETDPVPHLGIVQGSNPCGEFWAQNYSSCNLGSINLAHFVTSDQKVDWSRLGETINLSTRFLNDVTEINKFPETVPELKDMNDKTRHIGLGPMGFADMLVKLGISYDSEEAVNLSRELSKFLTAQAWETSGKLAQERGPFTEWERSEVKKRIPFPVRNCDVTLTAPTGTISRLASCSSGIEPYFALAYKSNVLWTHDGAQAHLIDIPVPLQKELSDKLDDTQIQNIEKQIVEILDNKRLRPKRVRKDIRKIIENVVGTERIDLYKGCMDFDPEWHVKILAAWQENLTNGVSKTLNLVDSATQEDIDKLYRMAWKMGVKSTTVYRDQSKSQQVLEAGNGKAEASCPSCDGTNVLNAEGCHTCADCGWSACDAKL